MDMTEIPYRGYTEIMMPLIRRHYSETSKFCSSENITHYLRVIMFGCYNVETKNIIDDLACYGVTFGVQAAPTEYLASRIHF
jgi:hypothetical protein